MKNKKYKNNKLKLNFIILGTIILTTFFLATGYATLESVTLDVDGEVTAVPQSEIFISDITYNSNVGTNPENSNINQYYQTLMQSTIVLGNDNNSSITYTVTLYNNGDGPYTFKEVEYMQELYDNPNIVFELDGLKKWDVVLSKESVTCTITFHYLNNVPVDNNILNSYLNFRFMKGTVDDTNIITSNQKEIIYNADLENDIQFEVTNNNDFAVETNLTIDNNIIATVSLEPLETKSIHVQMKDKLGLLQANKEYSVMIEQTVPYTVTKHSSVKLQFIPTITNYDLGLKTAGSSENPYIIYKIEDLVRLALNVNSGNSFLNTHIKLLNSLDFNNSNNYYNSQDTSFGDLNEDNSDLNEILTEMTSGKGFIMIGNSEINSFQGIFDGDNNRIDNIYIHRISKDIETQIGFFCFIKDAKIKNIEISGHYTIAHDGGALVGGISGKMNTITNCHNNVNITNTAIDKSTGGLVGTLFASSETIISECSNLADITTGCAAGGLVGFVISSVVTVENCYNTGTIMADDSLLGDGIVSSTFAGGLVVKDSSGGGTIIIKNSYNSGNVTANVAGGLVAKSAGELEIDSSYNTGNVSGTGTKAGFIGGILGRHSSGWMDTGVPGIATITNTYNAGIISKILGETKRGGIIGYNIRNTRDDISKAYYLEQQSINNIGEDTGRPPSYSCSRTEEFMKSNEFVTLLGPKFTNDTNNINKGYPVLIK